MGLLTSGLISVSLLVAEQDVVPAFFAAAVAAAGSVFAAIAPSVAGGAARLAAFALRRHFVLRVAGGPVPVAAEVSAAVCLAVRIAFPAVSGISGPASDYPCLEDRDAQPAEARWDAPR
jgi:hypothetical protein